MSKVRRIYVEKKDAYAVKAKDLKKQFKDYLGIKADNVRVLTRYDMEGVSEDTYKKAKVTIFSEPPIDVVYEESFPMRRRSASRRNIFRDSLISVRILQSSVSSF